MSLHRRALLDIKMEKRKIVNSFGKRKTSVARATITDGKGIVRINSTLLNVFTPGAARMKIQETMMFASDYVDLNSINIKVVVNGGGTMGQSSAITCAIARGLVEWSGSDELLKTYQNYDRTLIAADSRQTEVHKPSQSSKGPRHRRQKSYR